MAIRQSGFTRASALGPIAAVVASHGGSISRVFSDVDLPEIILEQPDLLVPLKEQFQLLHRAGREIGDIYFGASLGQMVRADKLSAFGQWVTSSPNLKIAIARSNAGLNTYLQTATTLRLTRHGPRSTWSIAFHDPCCEGRLQNELLGVSYLIDTIRCFAGDDWRPLLVQTTAPPKATAATRLEQIFGANVTVAAEVSLVEFETSLLNCPPVRYLASSAATKAWTNSNPDVPATGDLSGAVSALVRIASYRGGYPQIDWIASKLGLSRRTLQRHLANTGASFGAIVEGELERRAAHLLDENELPITQIAYELGYTDVAHFTRAFKRWKGVTPSAYRSSSL